MIPVTLRLKNFTSYGADVPPLDFTQFHLACLSGTNGSGKSSILDAITYALWGEARDRGDGLVHLGANEMETEFEFLLETAYYRVNRSRNVKKQATELSLFSKSAIEKEWLNITEGTIKDTQQKIDYILKTSYETFCNSAFLRQGRADEFTLKGATERKKILGEILGLTVFDELETKAKDVVKDKSQNLIRLETQLGEIENELGQAEIRKTQMEQAEAKVGELEERIHRIDEQLNTLSAEKETYIIEQSSRQQIEKSIARLKSEVADSIQQKEKKERTIEQLTQTLTQKEEIEKQYELKKGLQEENDSLNEKQSQLLALTTQKAHEESRIQKDKTEQEKKITQLETQLLTFKNEAEKLKTERYATESEKKNCPLCGSVLDEEHRQDVVRKLDAQLTELRQKYQSTTSQLQEVKSTVVTSDILTDLTIEIEAVSYDETRHRGIKQQLMALGTIEQKMSAITSGVATLAAEQEAIKLLTEAILSKQKTLAEDEKLLEGKEDVTEKLQDIQSRVSEHEAEKRTVLAEERQARAVLGEAKGLVSRSQQLSDIREQKHKERDILAGEKSAYEELALAFGKKGIQAMLIETAIPEIEEETNRLLDRLTDGKMRVLLQTQKDTKKGDTVETLEIIISDELGSRPYELYSGGETFRVNFALRLALSRLLTHRAGTKLQFLVIDEGFGTQDSAGREKLVDVINEIKDDFEKIVVVTHIEELKDVFPARIEVEKKADGSTFSVIGA